MNSSSGTTDRTRISHLSILVLQRGNRAASRFVESVKFASRPPTIDTRTISLRAMSAITRYIVLEFLKIYCATVSVVALFVLLFMSGERAHQSGLPPEYVYLILPYLVPYSIKSALQAGTLFATCVVYGRMAATNEIITLKSMGLSPLVAVLPTIIVAIPLSAITPLLDDVHSGWCCGQIREVFMDHLDDICLASLRDHEMVDYSDFSIQADQVVGDRMYGVRLNIVNPKSDSVWHVTAAEAYFQRNAKSSSWNIVVVRGSIHADKFQMTFTDMQTFVLPAKPGRAEAFTWGKVIEQRERVASLRKASMCCAEATQSAQRPQLDEELRRLRHQETQFMHKWANGFCCLGFVVVAAPVAILLRTSCYLRSFFICFLPTILVYQPLHKFPTIYAESGVIPTYFVWGADLMLILVGMILLRIVCRR